MTSTATLTESLTYAQLVAKIQANELKKGASYTITDFATAHYMLDGAGDILLDENLDPIINVAEAEPLTIMALSNNTLSHEARSSLYPQDVIHYDWNPENWKFDLGFSAWDEVVLTEWKGVITFRKATINNVSCGYDFRNVKLRRWEADAVLQNAFVLSESAGYEAWGLSLKSPESYQDYITFNCSSDALFQECVKNVNIMPQQDNINQAINQMSIISNNVFHVDETYLSLFNVLIGDDSHLNTFVGYTANIQAKNHISNNLIIDCHGLDIGHLLWNCYLNSVYYCRFAGFNRALNLGMNTENNTFEPNVSFIKIPDKTYGNGCRNNMFKPAVQGTSMSVPLDFTSATHVFAAYNCEIFKASDGAIKLSYVKEDTGNYTFEIVDATA